VKKSTFFNALVVLVITAIVIMGIVQPAAAADKKYGGVMVVGWTQEPKHLFPSMEATIQAGLLHRAGLYETLVGFDTELKPIPWLAKSWKEEEGGKKWTFNLVDNAKWHDGKPLTAKDVKFTIEYVKANQLSSALPYVADISRVETPDDYTVVIYYDEPIAGVLSNLQYLYILPEEHFKDITGDKALSYTNPNPIGSGPFKFVAWKKSSELVLKANEDYRQGRPYLDTIVFKYYNNKNSLLLAMKSGEIHAIPWEISVISAEELKKTEGIEVTVDENIYYRWINFNVSDFGKQNPTLRDRSVRLALNHAIDRPYLCDLIHAGYVTPGIQIVQPSLEMWFNDSLHPYVFDIDLANNILDKAGYTEKDDDGVRKSADGVRLEYDLLALQRFPEEVRAAEHIRGTWKEIGVKLNIQVVDGATILSKLFPNYEQDMYLWGFDGRPDPTFILGLLTKDQIQNYNGAGYANPVYDALYELQKKTTDLAQRQYIVDRMQSILHEDAPHAVLYNMSSIAAYNSDKFAGFVQMPTGIFSNLNAYSLKEAHLLK
jgi:peptide/nickel transport system substrate-binding protein